MTRFPNPLAFLTGNKAGFVFLALLFLAAISSGCAGSSPRFKGSGTKPAPDTGESQPRFATRVRQEEMAEDDRKVDIEEVKEQFSNSSPPRTDTRIDRKKVMTEILGLIGTPYAYGSNSSDGMDCSGFTSHVYGRAAGIPLPRATENQFRIGKSIGPGRLKFGDLVFFNTTGASPSHVGIFIGEDLFAHASISYGVTVSSLQSSYYNKRYIGARRVAE